MKVASTIANSAWAAANWSRTRKFQAALANPRAAQLALFAKYARSLQGTRFAQDHGLHRSFSITEFQHRVPIRTCDDFLPYIEQIASGQPNVLTAEPVERFVPSSGSTRAAKLIPYTRSLRNEFNNAIAPWVNGQFALHPSLRNGPAYWSISPASQPRDQFQGKIPVGFDDDSQYLGPVARRLSSVVLAVPSVVRHINSIESWRYVTNLFLLRSSNLRFMSVWHPSFLALLLDGMEQSWHSLLRDIAHGTCTPPESLHPDLANVLSPLLSPTPSRSRALELASPQSPRTIWPNVSVVSCWADAHAAHDATSLRKRLDDVTIAPKGLVATEGIVSIPWERTHPLAITSHLLEFLDSSGNALLADELSVGHSYEVILTTGGGLYRYRTGDRIVVTGLLQKTPTIRFTGREDHVADLRGEKLSEGFVTQCLGTLFQSLPLTPAFAMLAPTEPERPAGYVLYLQADDAPPDLAARLDTLLRANPHYAHAQNLGQLKPLALVRIRADASRTYFDTLVRHGLKLGDIKPAALSTRTDWNRHFELLQESTPIAEPV